MVIPCGQCTKYGFQCTVVPPLGKSRIHGLPGAIRLRQFPPLRSAADDPEHPIQYPPVIFPWTSPFSRPLCWKQLLHASPLFFCQFIPLHGLIFALLFNLCNIYFSNKAYFHIGKAVGERVSFLKDTEVPYEDGSHVFFLNSRYTEANASKPILEFLDLIRTNDMERPYEMPLGQKARKRIQEVRGDKELEVSYMTYAQKMLDERRLGYEEGLRESITAFKGILEPSVIAERLKLSLEQVMEILGQG